MVAPRSWALTVTIREPTQITTKTVVNTWEVCFAGAFDDSISASDRQINSGPLDDAISVRSDENVRRRVSPQLLTTASCVRRLGYSIRVWVRLNFREPILRFGVGGRSVGD